MPNVKRISKNKEITIITSKNLAPGAGVDGVNFTGVNDIIHYGVCNSGPNSVIKMVYIPDFKLYNGASVSVKFRHASAVTPMMLNVSYTGARLIVRHGETPASKKAWVAGEVVDFVFDGMYWHIV